MDLSNAKPIVTPAPTAPVGEPPTPPVEETPPVVDTNPAPKVVEDVIVPDPSPVPDELSLTSPDPVPTTVTETGNKTIDAVGKLLADKGVTDPDGIINEAIKEGELSLANQSALVDALGETMAGIVLNQLEGEIQATREIATQERGRLLEYAAEAFGDKPEDAAEVWKAMQTFARSPEAGLSESDRAAMNAMLAKGGMQAELVIDKLKSKYFASTGYTQEADLLVGESTINSSFEAMSKTAYTAKMREIVNAHGYDSPEAERLRAQRNESIQRGY